MDPFGVLFSFGAALVLCGSYYRTPFPVQPMKAVGAVATTQAAQTAAITPGVVLGAGVVTGLIWLALGLRAPRSASRDRAASGHRRHHPRPGHGLHAAGHPHDVRPLGHRRSRAHGNAAAADQPHHARDVPAAGIRRRLRRGAGSRGARGTLRAHDRLRAALRALVAQLVRSRARHDVPGAAAGPAHAGNAIIAIREENNALFPIAP